MRTLILIFFLLIMPSLRATHIIGGEIYYDCLGNGQFRITLKLYRDCLLGQAPFDDPATVSIYNQAGALVQNVFMNFPGSNVLSINTLNPCYQDNAQVCVEEAIYTEIVELDPISGGYSMTYQRCCRNESILNIFGPGDTGSTYTAQIPESAFTDCNSSPRFSNFPPIVLCVNDPLIFDHSATDPDGDQLVYSFCSPFEGASTTAPMPVPAAAPPYNFVNFVPPYSANNPLASTPGAAVDPVNGELTAFPTQLGQHVVAVCVSEYRNGVLLSVNKRDFQFNVLNCNGVSIADFVAPTADIETGNVCNGLMVSFQNQSEFSVVYQWDFGVPGVGNDISTATNPTYLYPDTGQYTVMLISNPGYSCSDTSFLEIAVYREIDAEIEPPDPQCITTNSFDFTAGILFENSATFFWEFTGPSNISTSTLQNPQNISWSEPGVYPVYLTINDPHCTDSDTIDVTVYPELNVDFSVNSQNECEPARIVFTNESSFSPGATLIWDFGDGNTSNQTNPVHVYTEPGIYDVRLIIENIVGCIDTVELFLDDLITIRPSPNAGIDANPRVQSILTPEVEFTDLSTEFLDTWLEPGNGDFVDEPTGKYYYSDTGTYYAKIVAVNEVGCYDTALVKIKIEPIYAFFIPNAFSPNDDGVNDLFSPKGEGIKTYEMFIFDRWGDQIFYTDKFNQQWDGRANDGKKPAPLGVYNYKVLVLDMQKTEHIYVGKVTLVR